jgi:hypothetical protein
MEGVQPLAPGYGGHRELRLTDERNADMANLEGTVTEDIIDTISVGQKVYDSDDRQCGTVDWVDLEHGYVLVAPNPVSVKEYFIPFHLITSIDPHELYVSVDKDELHRDYSRPPARTTSVANVDGAEIATTTEPDGYGGAPIVADRVRVDELKRLIAVGDRVYTSDLIELGTIKRYDPVTGWMLVERGPRFARLNLMVPVTIVADVVDDANEVYLAISQHDFNCLRLPEPSDVVFVEARSEQGS